MTVVSSRGRAKPFSVKSTREFYSSLPGTSLQPQDSSEQYLV